MSVFFFNRLPSPLYSSRSDRPLLIMSVKLSLSNRFHCLFCHGYEERGGSSAGVLASGLLGNTAFAPGIARMANRLAGAVNVYTDGNEALGADIRLALKNTKRFRIENRKIGSVAKDPDVQDEAGILVTLEDGTVNRESFIVSQICLPCFFSLFSSFISALSSPIHGIRSWRGFASQRR